MKPCSRCGYSPSDKSRSNNQNKYYWGCVLPLISEHTGFTINETHEFLKAMFLKAWKTIKTRTGEHKEVEYIKSTTDVDTKSFEEYMTQIREWASIEIGCYIPAPNEQLMES